jgi:Aldehyde dehydrogenase family
VPIASWCKTSFTKRLAETAGAMKVADGFEPGAVIGPLMDMKAVEKVEAHIADAVKKGAKVVTGGKRAAQAGSFFEPAVLTEVTTDMVITKEETFGPVAPLYRLKTKEEAITNSRIAAERTTCWSTGLTSRCLKPSIHTCGRRSPWTTMSRPSSRRNSTAPAEPFVRSSTKRCAKGWRASALPQSGGPSR